MSLLHISKFILVLNEEATTVFAHVDGNVRNHVLEVALWHVGAKVAHVLDKHLLEAHTLHNVLIDAYWLISRTLTRIRVLEQDLSEEIIVKALVLSHR